MRCRPVIVTGVVAVAVSCGTPDAVETVPEPVVLMTAPPSDGDVLLTQLAEDVHAWQRAVWQAELDRQAVARAEVEARGRAQAASASSEGLGRCGGTFPPCWVLDRESGGRPDAVNASGCGGRGCFGRWQFDPRTWDATAARAGRPDLIGVRPDHASAADQDLLAAVLWDGGHGCSHWAAC